MEGIISGILVSLLIGLGIGFAVGRKAASAQSGVGSKLAIQQALDSQKAQLAHALANHRQQLAQLEQSVAQIRTNLDDGARELLGELPSTRVEVSRLSRPESGNSQPRDYAGHGSGLLRQRALGDDQEGA